MRWNKPFAVLALAVAIADCTPATAGQAAAPSTPPQKTAAAPATSKPAPATSTPAKPVAPKKAPPSPRTFTLVIESAGAKSAHPVTEPASSGEATASFARALKQALAQRAMQALVLGSEAAPAEPANPAPEAASKPGLRIIVSETRTGSGIHIFYPLAQYASVIHGPFDQWTAGEPTPNHASLPLARSVASALRSDGQTATLEPAANPALSHERGPAIAIELAPLRDPAGAAQSATDPAWQQRVATTLAKAIAEWHTQRLALDAGAATYARKVARP